MIYIILNTIIMSLVFILALFVYYKSAGHRKNALLILRIRPVVKLSALFIGLIILLINFPQSLYLLGYILSFILICFSLDIIVEKDGIYYGLNLITWNKIIEISNHSTYLMIKTDRRFKQKGFLKIVWKISSEDIKQVKSLFSEKSLRLKRKGGPPVEEQRGNRE